MAKTNVRGLPTSVKSAVAKGLVGANLENLGRVRPFPLGTPADDWVVSVLPKSASDAKKILSGLSGNHAIQYEVFPYGIINPEIGRIDIRFNAGR